MKPPKVVNIISGGRNGSLFLQSLLDGHPEILQLPGIFLFDELLDAASAEQSAQDVAETFRRLNPAFFDSRANPLHGMDRLGPDRRSHFEVPFAKFASAFSTRRRDNRDLARQSLYHLLYDLHVAYASTAGDRDLESKRVLVLHGHHANRMRRFSAMDFEVVFVERDPLPSLQAEIDGWIKFSAGGLFDLSPPQYIWSVRRKVFELSSAIESGKPVCVVRLEDIHRRHRAFFDSWCARFGLSWNAALESSTFMGLQWWGDAISGGTTNGINPSFANRFDSSRFDRSELAAIEGLMQARLRAYGYAERTEGASQLHLLRPGKSEREIIARCLQSVRQRSPFSRAGFRTRVGFLKGLLLSAGWRLSLLAFNEPTTYPPALEPLQQMTDTTSP